MAQRRWSCCSNCCSAARPASWARVRWLSHCRRSSSSWEKLWAGCSGSGEMGRQGRVVMMSSSLTLSQSTQWPQAWGRLPAIRGCTSEVVGGAVFGLGTCVHTPWAIGDVMSQKRHSCLLGTRAAGFSAASLRINAPRFCMNWSSTASAGMRAVWSRYVTYPLSLRFWYRSSALGMAYR